MAKSKVTSVLLKILGFLGLIALFIAFLVFIYGLFLYMFEGEKLSFENFSITEIFKKDDKDKEKNPDMPEDKTQQNETSMQEGNLKNNLAICLENDILIVKNL